MYFLVTCQLWNLTHLCPLKIAHPYQSAPPKISPRTPLPKLAQSKSIPKPQKQSPQIYPFGISSKSVSNLPPKHPPKSAPNITPTFATPKIAPKTPQIIPSFGQN